MCPKVALQQIPRILAHFGLLQHQRVRGLHYPIAITGKDGRNIYAFVHSDFRISKKCFRKRFLQLIVTEGR